MFGFLRSRRHAPPALKSPLRSAHWDGAVLTLALEPGARRDIALDLDGCFFASVPLDADATARFKFAFSPSGHT